MSNKSAHVHTEKTKGRDNHARAPSAPTEGEYANKAPVRQQSATHKGARPKSPFCVVLKTYHLNTWILHKTCLKHSKFLHRKFCAHGTSWQQLWDRELKKTQRVETRFKTRQFQHKWKERKMVHLMRST